MKAELIQKSRKEYTCSKCGKLIQKGSPYYRITGMYMPTKCRCATCKPERSELTTSDYLSWLYNLQDHLDDLYDFEDDGVLENLSSELSDQMDELQGRLDEMPEAFQDTSDAGIQLSERIESLEDAMNEIDGMEYPDKDSEDFQTEDDEATFVFGEELAAKLAEVITSYPTTEDHYTADDVSEFMVAAGYSVHDEETDYTSDEFDVEFKNGDDKVVCHFEVRTHYDEDAFQSAIEDLRDEVREVIDNIAE